MKRFGPVLVFCALLALAGCGDEASSSDEAKEPRPAKITKPDIDPPEGPPPEELVVEEVWDGSGPSAEEGDKVKVHYQGVDMDGKQLYSSWRNGSPFIFKLGGGFYGDGFEQGVEGMQVGDRRELIVPADLAPFDAPVVYVVDLLKVEPPSPSKEDRK